MEQLAAAADQPRPVLPRALLTLPLYVYNHDTHARAATARGRRGGYAWWRGEVLTRHTLAIAPKCIPFCYGIYKYITFIEKLTKFCSVALMSLVVNYSH